MSVGSAVSGGISGAISGAIITKILLDTSKAQLTKEAKDYIDTVLPDLLNTTHNIYYTNNVDRAPRYFTLHFDSSAYTLDMPAFAPFKLPYNGPSFTSVAVPENHWDLQMLPEGILLTYNGPTGAVFSYSLTASFRLDPTETTTQTEPFTFSFCKGSIPPTVLDDETPFAVLTIDSTHFIPVHIDGIQEFTQGDVHHFRVRNNNSALTKVRLSSFNFIINRI